MGCTVQRRYTHIKNVIYKLSNNAALFVKQPAENG